MARVKWIEESTFLGIDAHGKSTVMSAGADGPGVGPMQMLLLGLGGCALIDLVLILKKQRQPFDDVEVHIDGKRAEGTPSPWKTIHLHFTIKGDGMDAARVERAVKLSVEKYCSVQATLTGVADITYDVELVS